MKASFKLLGAKEINRALNQLSQEAGKRVVKREMRRAVKPIYQRTLEKAPLGMTSQTLSAVKIKSYHRKGRIKFVVQVGKGDFKGKTYYAAFYHMGTKKKDGSPKMIPRPWMREAFDETKDAAALNAEKLILAGIEKEVKKLARKTLKANAGRIV